MSLQYIFSVLFFFILLKNQRTGTHICLMIIMSTLLEKLEKLRGLSKSRHITQINKSLFDFHERELSFTRSAAEIKDITSAVEEMVEKVILKFGDYGPTRQYEVSHKYLVGSMAEGTRIKEPNEFDFLVVLKELSKPGALKIKLIDNAQDCSTHFRMRGHALKHVHVKVLDSKLQQSFEFEILDDGYLRTIIGLEDKVDMLNEAIAQNEKVVILKDTGRLSILDITSGPNGPAGTFELQWIPKSTLKSQNLQISVDTVLAIEIPKTMAKREDASVPQYFNQLEDDKSCLLLPGNRMSVHDQRCFMCTFARTEVKLMKSLSEFHKACYRLMKYIVAQGEKQGGREVSIAFPSYLIKTIVLRHSVQCSEKENFLVCIVDIITKISETCSQHPGDNVHLAERTLFFKDNFVSETPYGKEEMQQYLECLTDIVKLVVSHLK